jgi:hypothetical protein
MSQGIEETRHFGKSLGISRNALAIGENPGISRIEEICDFLNLFKNASILGNSTLLKSYL